MSPVCARGHESQTTDYCDVCGLKLADPAIADSTPPEATGPGPLVDGTAESATASSRTCPHCQEQTDLEGDFCENCGGDLRPGAANTEPAPVEPAPASGSAPSPPEGEWEVVVSADRAYFARFDSDDLEFPEGCPERRVELAATQASIGRRSTSRGLEPEIDLAGPPEDSAASHDHAVLHRHPDGGWSVVDSGSSNGTFVNDDLEPLVPGQPVDVDDGDRIHVGAWTTIVLRRTRPANSEERA